MRRLKDFDAVFNPTGKNIYVLCEGKKRTRKELCNFNEAMSHLDNGGTVGYWVQEPYVVVDIDDRKTANTIYNIVKKEGLDLLVGRTSKGIHIYGTGNLTKQSVKAHTPIGAVIDTRTSNKGYVLLPYGDSEIVQKRLFINDDLEVMSQIPDWLLPLTISKDKEQYIQYPHPEGNRNDALLKQMTRLSALGFDKNQMVTVAMLINKYVFKNGNTKLKEIENVVDSSTKYPSHPKIDNPELMPFHLLNTKGFPNAVNHDAIVEHVISQEDIVVVNKEVYVYDNGVYNIDHNIVKDMIKNCMYQQFRKYYTIRDIYNMLIEDSRITVKWEQMNRAVNYVNMTNGMFNMMTGELEPHDPKYLSTVQIPHSFSRKYKDIRETKFYDMLIKKGRMKMSDFNMLLEYMLYVMTIDNTKKAFMILYGRSNTGKTTVINFIQEMVNVKYVANLEMHELNLKFYPAKLKGAVLNACADNNSNPLTGIENIKKITGGDYIMHEKKGMNPYFFKPFSKLLFSFNQLPLQLEEKSDAFYNRMRILQMDVAIKLNSDYIKELLAEVPDMVNFLLDNYDRYWHDTITVTKTSKLLVKELRMESDSIEAFLDSCVSETKDTLKSVAKEELYNMYNAWCEFHDRNPFKKRNFYRNMQVRGYKTMRRLHNGKKCESYVQMHAEMRFE